MREKYIKKCSLNFEVLNYFLLNILMSLMVFNVLYLTSDIYGGFAILTNELLDKI